MEIIKKLLKFTIIGSSIMFILGLTTLVINNDNVTEINGAFEKGKSELIKIDLGIFNFIVTDGERALIVIDSPGGLGSEARKISSLIKKSKVKIDTYVPTSAASAGAWVALLGDKLYVEKDSEIMLHGGHYGTYSLTEVTLQRCLDQIQNGRLLKLIETAAKRKPLPDDVTLEEMKALDIAFAVIAFQGLNGFEQTVKAMLSDIKAGNAAMVNDLSSALSKKNPIYTPEYVKTVMFHDFMEDVTFTGQQLIDMGLAEEYNQ